MARTGSGSSVLLDWASISYRSIMRTVVYVVLLAALGGLFYYLKASLRSTPEDLAMQDLARAEGQYREAQAAVAGDPVRRKAVNRAGRFLETARRANDRREFVEARAAAQQSLSFSAGVLQGGTGDAFTAKIFKQEGDVKVKRARQFVWDGVRPNTALHVGDQIKTASNGHAQILYFDGTITTIKPGSLVEIREVFEDPTTKVRKIRERLNFGEVSATTPGSNVAGSFHEVTTGSATTRAGSKAQFDVSYDKETRRTRAAVHRGTAEVRAGGRTLKLKPLERMEVSRDNVVTRRKILPAPALLDPADNRILQVDGRTRAVASLRWSAVKGSKRYRLQISRTTLFGDLLLNKPDVRSTRVQIPGLKEGNYFWRVSVIDREGDESAFSETRRFRVKGTGRRASEDRIPPALQVNEFLPSGHIVIIHGRTEPGVVLTVDGQTVEVYEDGGFTAVVRLRKEGRNDLEIVAQDPAGNETRMRRHVFLESF